MKKKEKCFQFIVRIFLSQYAILFQSGYKGNVLQLNKTVFFSFRWFIILIHYADSIQILSRSDLSQAISKKNLEWNNFFFI